MFLELYPGTALVWIAIEIFSTILLVYLTVRLLRSKQRLFKSAFFRIFIASAIFDVVSVFWHAALRHMIINMGECIQYLGPKNYSLIYKSIYYGSSVLLTCHLGLTLLVSVNRCTSVGSPVFHEKLWCFQNTMIAIVSQCLIGFPAWVFIMFSDDAVMIDKDGNIAFVDLDAWTRGVFHAVGGAVILSRTCACLLLSIYTVRKLFKATGGAQSSTERKLCFHAVFVFIGSFIMVFQQFIKMYAAHTNDIPLTIWISEQFFWINDVFIFSNLYSIIFCSSHVRTFLKPKKYFRVQLVTVSTAPSMHSNIPTITTTSFAR